MSDWTSLISSLNAAVLEAFGREVQYLPQSGGEYTIRAIFEATERAEESVGKSFAVVFIRLADLTLEPERGDLVRVGESNYKVFEIEADNEGGARLGLHAE